MQGEVAASIVTAIGAIAGSALAIRNSRAARRDNREQEFVRSAEKRAQAAEARAQAAESKAIDSERRMTRTELRAERAEFRMARLEQNEQLNELEIQRLRDAARQMAAWIYGVVDATERGRPAAELRRIINGGPPEAIPFRGQIGQRSDRDKSS